MGGLTPAELATIRGRLEGFADDVFASLARADQRTRGQCYLRGLMLDGRRKSIEPMAGRLGEVHYQALHHFVATSPWDWRLVRRRLAELLTAALAPTAWVVDDTGFPKDGDCSVGVQRQYSGTLGKRANCQLGVSVNAVCEHASCPLDWRLFLPEGWDEDAMASRRAACHLPEQVHHRPKWQLVLDMLDELAGWELSPPVLLADSGYGAELAMAAGQRSCVELIWRRGSKGLQRGRFLALRVRPAGVTPRRLARAAGTELPARWLLVEWPVGKPEPTKYWLANLPQTTPLVELVRLARLRWRVEQDYRELKGGLGWTISKAAAGWAGTTTSRWSRSRMVS